MVSSSDSSRLGRKRAEGHGGEAKGQDDEGPPKCCNCIPVRCFLFVVFSLEVATNILYLIFSDFISFKDGLQIKFDFINSLALALLIFAIIGLAGALLKNALFLLIIAVMAGIMSAICLVLLVMATYTYFKEGGVAATIEMHPNMMPDEPDQNARAFTIYFGMAFTYLLSGVVCDAVSYASWRLSAYYKNKNQ